MSFKIVVTEYTSKCVDPAMPDEADEIERYSQIVDEIDLRAVMQAVNQRKRGPRVGKKVAP